MEQQHVDTMTLKTDAVDFLCEQLQHHIQEQERRADGYMAMGRYWLTFWGALAAFFSCTDNFRL